MMCEPRPPRIWDDCWEYVQISFDNAEPQISSRRGHENTRSFQFRLRIDERLEKAQPFANEDGDDAEADFINQSGSQALLSGLRAAYHRDLFVPCGCFCLLDSAFNAIGDEGHCQAVVLAFDRRFWNVMRQDKNRHLIFVTRKISPKHIIGTAAHYHRARCLYFFLQHLSFVQRFKV